MIPASKKFTRSAMLLVAGLWIFWGFGYETAWKFLSLQIDGTIVAVDYDPARGAPRYAAVYHLETPDGGTATYVAGATDASLPRDMPIGSKIRKDLWDYRYTIDGTTGHFPMAFYGPFLAAGLALTIAGSIGAIQEVVANRKRTIA